MKAWHSLRHSYPTTPRKCMIPLGLLKDSQSSNPGSIPGSATNFSLFRHFPALKFVQNCQKPLLQDVATSGGLAIRQLTVLSQHALVLAHPLQGPGILNDHDKSVSEETAAAHQSRRVEEKEDRRWEKPVAKKN
jgi:hypothetical protein